MNIVPNNTKPYSKRYFKEFFESLQIYSRLVSVKGYRLEGFEGLKTTIITFLCGEPLFYVDKEDKEDN